jgi:glycosyltransferase involved in cell wall biosynthesis
MGERLQPTLSGDPGDGFLNNRGRVEERPVIAFFVGSSGDWGGASRVIYTLLRALNRERLEPLILLPRKGPILPELEAQRLRYVIWGPLTELSSARNYLSAYLRTLFFLRRERVRLIHINHAGFWRPAELLAAYTLRVPVVAHYHVVHETAPPFMRLCRAAVSVSHYTADHSLPVNLEKPVIYNAIDLERFDSGISLRAELGLSPTDMVVSFLGQIRDIKGVQDFIAMARRIEDPRSRFLIAGECRNPQQYPGSYTAEDLKAMIGEDPRIRYIGYVARPENVYQTSDVIVVPSRWQEPLGLINLEAGACRKAVVATRVGGIPEAICDGVTGHLVGAGDVEGLARRVQQLIDDPVERARMGESARLRVERDFTTKRVVEFEDLLLRYVSMR